MSRLWYFPIEQYEERYTAYLSDFWETFLKGNKIQHNVVTGRGTNTPKPGRIRVGKGQVLDTYKRSAWCMSQIQDFLWALDQGLVSNNDVVYIEDFWHFGFEALPYARDMYGVDFKIYAWCHADSWDETDFTFYKGMAPWKRHFEKGIAKCLEGMFVADAGLKELIIKASGDLCPIYSVGTCWNTEWIRDTYRYNELNERDNVVVFASRWDEDKDPLFFCNLVNEVANERSDVRFVITTGFEKLVSNDPLLLDMAHKMQQKLPGTFEIKENMSKLGYMNSLNYAKVQFNCAHHDWVSYALLESCAMGCMPLFPDYRSFPAALQFDLDHLYQKRNLGDAKKQLYKLLDMKKQKSMNHIFKRFDNTIPYVAHVMGLY